MSPALWFVPEVENQHSQHFIKNISPHMV